MLTTFLNNNSIIADMAAQFCTSRIIVIERGVAVFNAFFSVISENVTVNHISAPSDRFLSAL